MVPVVLHHGLFGQGFHVGRVGWLPFRKIDCAIAAAGYDVMVTSVNPTAGIPRRAEELKSQILRLKKTCGSQPVVLIAHSLGGLDARYMLSQLGMSRQVRALVTISTPHRGSPWADQCVENIDRPLRIMQAARRLGLDLQGILDLTTESCRDFNKTIFDVPGVEYYSLSAAQPQGKMPAVTLISWKTISKIEGANDGLVSVKSVKSARWGTHLGTWPSDHWHTVNQRWTRESIRLGDISPRYLEILAAVAPLTKRAGG